MKKITDKNKQFNNAEFDAGSEFGEESKFGAYAKFGAESEFGSGSKFGSGCSYRGFAFKKFMSSANIDGSGRQIKIFSAGKAVMVEAGCFWGTAEEFCNRAKKEGKNTYFNVVGAIAKAIVK